MKRNEELILIKISKDQRDYLEECGFTFPEDLHRTYGKHKTYYATESPKVLAALKIYDSVRISDRISDESNKNDRR